MAGGHRGLGKDFRCRPIFKKHLPPDDPYREKADIIIRETLRLEKMMKDMLDFTRPLAPSRKAGDVRELVTRSISVVAHAALEKGVKIQEQLAGNPPPASLDAFRLEQVLLNLLSNAVEASPPGEIVTVGSYSRDEEIVVEVQDNGPGVPRDKREEIFFPFLPPRMKEPV